MSFKELQIFEDKVTSWPQLISNLLVAPACLQCCFWLACTFLHPGCFCLAYHYFLSLLYRSIYADATLKLNFKKLIPASFVNFHYRVIHQYILRISKLMQMICQGSKLWQKSTRSVITFHKHIQVRSLS